MNIKDKDKVELAVMYYESGTSCLEAIEKVKALHSTDFKDIAFDKSFDFLRKSFFHGFLQ